MENRKALWLFKGFLKNKENSGGERGRLSCLKREKV